MIIGWVSTVPVMLQKMDIPAINLIRTSSNSTNNDYMLTDALDLYLKLKGTNKDKTFIRTAHRNTEYVIQGIR